MANDWEVLVCPPVATHQNCSLTLESQLTLQVDNAQGGLPGITDLVKAGSQSPSYKVTPMKWKFYMSKGL